jgi:branched-chain amino acid transport system substrate-binding protein
MERRRWAVVWTAVAVTILTACGNSGGGQQGSSSSPVELGAWLPLTGSIAVHGLAQKAGGDAYFKYLNDHGGVHGRKVDWVVEDNAYDPQKTVAAAHKLIDQDNVAAIAGANGTANTAASFSYVLDQAQVPIINTYGGDATWYTPVKPLLFGAQTLYETQAEILGKWAVKDGFKDILVVHSDPAAFVTVANNVAPGARAAGASVNVRDLSVKFNTTDYAPIVLQVKNMHPDAVVLILSTAELVAYLKQAAQQGLKTGVYTYAPNASADVVRLAGADAEGLKSEAFTLPPDDTSSPGIKEFVAAMQKYEPGTSPDYESLFTWALCKITVAAINRINGTINKDSIVKALEGMSNYDSGVMPPVTYSPKQHLGATQVQRVQLTGGKWTLVGKYVGADSTL